MPQYDQIGEYVVVCDEEGRLKGYPRNEAFYGEYAGTIIIVGTSGDKFVSLPDKMILYLSEKAEGTK